MTSFRDVTNTRDVNFSKLSYRDTCVTNTTVWGLDLLAQVGANQSSPWSVMGLVLRWTEAIDSVKNFAGSATSDDGMHAAGLLICGTMQLGCALSECRCFCAALPHQHAIRNPTLLAPPCPNTGVYCTWRCWFP
jgi:hypothetical protein